MNTTKLFTAYINIILAACLTLLFQAAYAGVAGHVQFVNGQVQITSTSGQVRSLKKADAVNESDTLTTAKDGSAQIKMLDGGLVAVRPDSKLKFDSFVFSGEADGNERSFFSLLRGGFRAITGVVGHKNKANYRITTAGATIGVRGTDHETFVVVPGSEMAAIAPVGTYNKVNVGETVMTTGKGTINILPNQMGFTSAADQLPQLQPINLNIFAPVSSPALQGNGGKTTGAVSQSAVVDSIIQEQNAATGNAVPNNTILRPIIDDHGGAAPPSVY
ncbi:MAG: FecR family protein [Pseudomonadota bacterium]